LREAPGGARHLARFALWLADPHVLAFVTLLGIPVALVAWILTGLWVLYCIARGWMALSAQKPMPL
jgi:uncharacterized membrane protein